MILEIGVTVTAPDQILTGSVTVTVDEPAGGQDLPVQEPNAQARAFSQTMRWGQR